MISPNGQCLWSFKAEDAFHSTPTVDEKTGIVFAGNYDHRMYAIDLNAGTLLWSRAYEKDIEDDIYSSPALTDSGAIIFGTNNKLVCLDRDGHELWRNTAHGRFEGTAALDHELGIGIVGTEVDGLIVVFEISSGQIFAQHKTNGFIVSSPSISRDSIAYVGSNDGYVYGVDLKTAALSWKSHIGCEFRYTPFTTLPSGNALFTGVDEKIHCLRGVDGHHLWALEIEGGFHSSPLITCGGDMVVGSHRKAMQVYQWAI
jgi:outer membrane protein assembly factor BamB